VLCRARHIAAIEVKSGVRKSSFPGLDAFAREFPVTRKILVGTQGMSWEEFLGTPVSEWLE